MSKIKSFADFIKMFAGHLREEWNEMDHKLVKIVVGSVIFIVSGLFWLYFFQHSNPLGIF